MLALCYNFKMKTPHNDNASRWQNIYNEDNKNLYNHINGKVKASAKQQNVQCHNDYALLQYNEKLEMLLQEW